MSSTENRRVYAHLFRPCRVGCVTMKNRMGMAPLTRCRADDNHVPTPIMKEYYASRASMGMIITESIMVQRNYSGFAYEPGLYSAEQVAAWRTITEAVHARGGLITAQIYHPGRATTPANLTSDKVRPMGPSAAGIPPNAEKCIAQWSRDGRAQTYPQRIHAMSVPEIGAAVKFFTRAARNAMAAGFDAVEIHAGGGYLIDSFLRDAVNQRTDEYGGTIENRSRLLLEVVDAVAEVIQPDRVGVRLTPLDTFNGQMDRQPKELTMYVCKQLDARKIAFVDVVRGDPRTGRLGNADVWVRSSFGGAVLASQGYTSMVMAEQAIVDGTVDAVLFGTYAVSNPDLVWRVLTNRPLNLPDSSTFFTRGIKGYTDYPICEPYNFCAPHAMVDSRVLSKGGSTRDSLCQRARAASMPVKMPQYFTLSQPLLIGTVTMKNRLVMGPMPRQRCDKHQCPTALMKSYYARRASYGLIISDPCEVEPGYTTYVRGAAISTKAQVRAWREIVDAVHQRGGLMYCQLHHGGRATLPCNIADGRDKRVVGPTKQGVPADVPCPAAFVADRRCQPHYPTEVAELSTRDIERIVQLYVVAAKNAMLAGFDGVEIHAGGGYLIDQFLRECSNTRKDDYGGSPSDRCHLLDRVVDAVAAAVGRRRIGVRISPTDLSRGMKATDQGVVAETVAKHMAERRIAYLTVASGSDGNYYGPVPTPILKTIRAGFHGVVMCDDNTGLAEAERRVVTDLVQGVCFTLSAIANPDIMFRAIYGVALAQPDTNTLFTHDRHGYDTYPTYAEMRGEAQADQLYRSGVDGSRYASEVPNSCIPVFTNGDSISASAAAHGVAKGNEKIVSSPIAQRLTSAVNSTRQRAPSILAAQSTEDTRSSIAARTISTESDSGSRILIYRNSRLRRRLSYGTAVVG